VHDEVRQARSADEPARDAAAAPSEPEPVSAVESVQTAATRQTLMTVLDGLQRVPADFETHPKLAKQLSSRLERFEQGRIDWALAEALALGSLVLQGRPVRLSGQDSGRGTFSQRHAVLHDRRNETPHVPLAHLTTGQAPFAVYDSNLSEFAVLGFEYGYSVRHPDALVLWEAQFGDFCNGAQVIIDQFLASAEDKWAQRSGLVLLLPHGYEGQGPEHSSGRIERFLQLCARDNLRVALPSTPAQYFHLLRRQALGAERKPLVVFTPKSMLRSSQAVCAAEELVSGDFRELMTDPRQPDADGVRRVLLCAGKLYYELDAYRQEHGIHDVAVLRVEQLFPLAEQQLIDALSLCRRSERVVWVQEEPRNMGPYGFMLDQARDCLPPGVSLQYVGRPASASPATGSHRRHLQEQEQIVRAAFASA
jgi:2-oxoglutarate dehydrogenase complex dehydrogenase (E1) component-like enzyme